MQKITKSWLRGALLLLLLPGISNAATTFDAGSGSNSGGGANTTSHSHTTGTGATIMTMGVTLAESSSFDAGTISTLTYGATNVLTTGTLITSRTSNGSAIKQYVYCLDSPAVGAATASLASTGATGGNYTVALSVMTFIGSTTCSGLTNFASASSTDGTGTTFSATVNGVASTSLVGDVVCSGTDLVVGASQTNRASADVGSNSCAARGESTQLGSTETNAVMSWTGTNDWWSLIAYEVPQAGGGGGPDTKPFYKRRIR